MRRFHTDGVLPLLFLSVLLLTTSSAFAQVEDPANESIEKELYAAPVPSEVPDIPNPGPDSRGIFVNKDNLDAFRSLLLAPLAAWIEGDSLVLRLARSLEFDWSYGDAWNAQTKKNLTEYNIAADGSLLVNPGAPEAGFPFGTAADLKEVDDTAVRARMILWNLSHTQAALRESLYEGELAWIGAQTVLRKSEARFYRRAFLSSTRAPEKPKILNEKEDETSDESDVEANSVEQKDEPLVFSGPNDLLQQELLQLRSPPVVFGYSQLSWRFRGVGDDFYWIFSPVIGRAREVLPANRSDSLLDGALSMDDFFVWSTKVQSVNVKLLEEKVLLVPFSSRYLQALVDTTASSEADALQIVGLHEKLDGTRAMTLWNHETRQVARYAPWVPTSAHFIPRPVWILELSPRDPYYATGREILIVDQNSMLPVYKIVYDKFGEFSRIVMAAWGLTQAKDDFGSVPYLGFLLAVDRGTRRASSFTPHRVLAFRPSLSEEKSPAIRKEMLKLLDIRNHGKRLKPEPPKVFVPSSVVPQAPKPPKAPKP